LNEGAREGIRGDVAFAQSCLETGNFTFINSVITPAQNNFSGMGIVRAGMKGDSFPTPQAGVRAQIHHLKAYANAEPIDGEALSSRFHFVTRGSAPYVEWLGQQENPSGRGWATGKGYGLKILNILDRIIAMGSPAEPELLPTHDNTPYEWEKKAVELAIARGIIIGDSTGNLRLHSPATRADVLVFLERAGVLDKMGG